jgi:isobutyryl-CoA mutase
VRRFVQDFADRRVAVVCVDPTKRRTGGALLGDRIRFNSLASDRVYLRSLATRGHRGEVSQEISQVLEVLKGADFDLILLETAGIGQGDSAITSSPTCRSTS